MNIGSKAITIIAQKIKYRYYLQLKNHFSFQPFQFPASSQHDLSFTFVYIGQPAVLLHSNKGFEKREPTVKLEG